ncbi:hypothetical protein L1049_019094 [Liquidambar formosana]|uniref:Uncharacterized protein n=1 Tax=Liquidambar formosana TaxID=63359 RepID=A0AAP0RC17_LIQFO
MTDTLQSFTHSMPCVHGLEARYRHARLVAVRHRESSPEPFSEQSHRQHTVAPVLPSPESYPPPPDSILCIIYSFNRHYHITEHLPLNVAICSFIALFQRLKLGSHRCDLRRRSRQPDP